ncbi:hypothetical protein SPETJ133_23610 [Staphylococcus petrasii]
MANPISWNPMSTLEKAEACPLLPNVCVTALGMAFIDRIMPNATIG